MTSDLSLDVLSVEDNLDLNMRQPWDISVVNSSTVFITLHGYVEEHQLQFVELVPRLQLRRVILLNKPCRGVYVLCDSIYITCISNVEIDVMTSYCSYARPAQPGPIR